MKGDKLIHTQLLMAQGFGALADAINNTHGFIFEPTTTDQLPAEPVPGTVMCVTDSSVTSGPLAGGGFITVLTWFNGTQWKVIAS